MNKIRYQVSYQGLPMFRTITRHWAQAKAFEKGKEKGWDLTKIEIQPVIINQGAL